MNLRVQRRIASEVLDCGVNRIWINPGKAEEVGMAITREDVRKLISRGIIKKKQEEGISRYRAQKRHEQRKKGRRRGHGTLKGPKFSRYKKKRRWINTIRPLRRELQNLYRERKLSTPIYRKLYRMAAGGAFRSVLYMKSYMTDHEMVKGRR
ncbi:MAG: 50S ribosomal protein L19e [Candidatus Methanofastidiosia archaeon]